MNRKTLALYWQQVRHHKRTFFTMLIAIPLGAAVIDSLLPYVLSRAIGTLSSGGQHLNQVLAWAAVVGLIGAALNFIGFRALTIHESHMLRRLRETTFASLMIKDNSFFVNQKIGAMTSRYIDFVRSYVNIQDLFIIRTLGFVLTMGTGVILLAQESWIVSAIIIGLIMLVALEIRWSAKVRAPWRHERKTLVSEIHGEVADALTNNMVVRSYAGESREIAHLNKKGNRFTHIFQKDIGFVMTEGSIRVLVMIIIQVVAVSVSAQLINAGTMTLATAIFVLAYMQRVGSQLFTLGDIINGYDQAFLDAQPMTEMLLQENIVEDDKGAHKLTIQSPSINFDNLYYRYPEGKVDVLQSISLDIPAGQKLGLVGHSGAGKSTIVSLLLRFADVTDGAIKIDGQDIRRVTQASLRESIAYVPQEPMLFHRSLRENIAYGKPGATDEEILDAAKKANALEFIEQLSDGLDTLVGERGIKLSGGQRQRVAIARAILKDAPILVLDEATSALDSESEKLIQESLVTLMKGRTSIVIAHRLSTIARLDRIVVLDNGKIVEDGSHTELLAQKGTYAKLWNHQSGGFIEE
jgi:ATP-binding cassette subfamily B protein